MYRTRNIKVSEHISLRVKDTDYASFRLADVLSEAIIENRSLFNRAEYDPVVHAKTETSERMRIMNLGKI